jgi:hypothetical protein
MVGIANSGLQSTTDVATWRIAVTEDLTDFDGGTDTVTVSYANASPTALAGSDVVYSAAMTTKLADGGVTDADLAVNAIIPGFESHSFQWSEGGGALPGGSVADVNVGIVNSGLTNTLDTTTFDLEVQDLAGDTDQIMINVSYLNSGPTIATAIATPVGADVEFALTVTDPDLAINALGLVDFELIQVSYLLDGAPFSGLVNLLANGTELVNNATLLSTFGGPGPHTLTVRVTDRTLQNQASSIDGDINFTVVAALPSVSPLGISLLCSLLGLAGWRRLRA